MKPAPRPFEPENQDLRWRLGLIRYCLTSSVYGRAKLAFREQLQAIYRWTWSGNFSSLESGALVSRKTTGIIRKGKNKMQDVNGKHLVVVDHVRPLVLQFADMQAAALTTDEEVYSWLASHNQVAHIHAEEDAALTSKGWRDKKRPVDAYEQLGIEIYYVSSYNRNKPIP
jgi:hypothetical protein